MRSIVRNTSFLGLSKGTAALASVRRIRTRALMVTVSNGPYVGAGMTVAPNARLDDGCFDVRVFRRFSKFRLLRHLVSIAFGRYRYAPEIDTYRSRFVRIESAHPLPARADSRDLGTTPIEFVTRPRKVREPVGPRSLTLAWALWLPGGLAGLHRLYLGRYVTGAIQALL